MNKKLSAFVMSITVWDDRGELDEAGFRRQLGRIRDAGVSVYIGSSGTGDGFAMNADEWDRVLAISAEEMKGRTGFRAMGWEPRTLKEMQGFLRLVEPYELDAVQVFSLDLGHAVRPIDQELETYYSTILDGTATPVVLSSFDSLGFMVPLDLIERLAATYPNLIGFVYGGRDPVYLTQLIARMAGRLEIHCAGPSNAMTTLALGGNGFLGHEGNLCPAVVAGVIAAFAAGDMEQLRSSFGKLMQIYTLHLRYGGSAGRAMKPLLNAFGLPGGTLRAPRTPISSSDLAELIQATVGLDLPDFPKRPKAA